MSADIDVYGVYVPELLALMLLALPVSLLARRLLARTGAYALVWHRGLFDAALYVVLLGALFALLRWWLP
ncbi:DUF1656 domain-containing protein [Ancylobacter lacus]|uniref:DUF1656 domain-containing protein n=1 Tax=Ancylobacter lacus TaxID=2579970 RepID=UPI001BCD7159|nr:DUF1656 domain-containing protein [Ancylobacter lacus]MBS7539840.1 DUF1656 domain-containing protein [Ancylobacter lacus]